MVGKTRITTLAYDIGMGYSCRLKLRLGGRKVRVALFMIVVLQGVNKSC